MFAVTVDRLAGLDGDMAWANVNFALGSILLVPVLVPFALGKELSPGLALAAETDPSALAEAGFEVDVERARAIVERVRAMTGGPRPDHEAQLDQLRAAEAPRPGTAGSQPWGERSQHLDHAPLDGPGFFLQRPLDRWARMARAETDDAELAALLDDWVAAIDANYRALAAAAETEHGEVHVEAEALDGSGEHGLHSPAAFRSVTGVDILVATDILPLEGGLISPQPDGIHAVAGERWMLRSHRLGDGTLLPCWGTHRISR